MKSRLVSLVCRAADGCWQLVLGDGCSRPGSAQDGEAPERWSSPPPASTRATASGPSRVPTTSSSTRSWRRCSRSIPRPASTRPRLAEKWEPSPDFKEWTFHLRKGVQFHYGYGEFTAAGRRALALADDAPGCDGDAGRRSGATVEEVKAVNDHQVVFRFKQPDAPSCRYAASRAGDLRIVSKAQWDKEGVEGLRQAAGRHRPLPVRRAADRASHQLTSAVDNHWPATSRRSRSWSSGIAREESTRLALLLSGEAHIADLPRELQKDALKRA